MVPSCPVSPPCLLIEGFMSSHNGVFLMNTWAGSNAISTTLPLPVVSPCVLAWLCSTDVSWPFLMTMQSHSSLSCGYATMRAVLSAGIWGSWVQVAGPGGRVRRWQLRLQTEVYIPSFANCIQRNKPKDKEVNTVVCGWIKVWIFHMKEQYLLFILANNSLYPDIRRLIGSANQQSYEHPQPTFSSHPSHYPFSLLSFFSGFKVLLFNTECQIPC